MSSHDSTNVLAMVPAGGEGSRLAPLTAERSKAVIAADVEVDECIVMDHTLIGRGARLRRVIVDRFNVVPPGTAIGFDPEQDRARWFTTGSGIVVLPKGSYMPQSTRFH